MIANKAHELAKKQRDIGVAEFFARNKHLLGFDNPRKALLTTVKEAVDNSIDACEEADILPEILVEVIDMENDHFRVIVEDNSPGIVNDFFPGGKIQSVPARHLDHLSCFNRKGVGESINRD